MKRQPISESAVLFLFVPLAWAICFCGFAVLFVFDRPPVRLPLDINSDGSTTIRDILQLIWGSWVFATLGPVLVLMQIFESYAPEILYFFEIPALFQWMGAWSVLPGLAAWWAIFAGLWRVEVVIRKRINAKLTGR
jgi:hypothetical protein